MPLLKIGSWRVDVDIEGTRRAYAEIERAGADSCTCLQCKNFSAVRDQVYSEEVKQLLGRLGVDWRKESEVVGLDQPNGFVLYMGWFHFLGKVETEPDNTLIAEKIDASFSFVLTDEYRPGPWSLQDGMVIEFFDVLAPWVLDEHP